MADAPLPRNLRLSPHKIFTAIFCMILIILTPPKSFMAYLNHLNINTAAAAAGGGVVWNHLHQIYIQQNIDSYMINFSAATYGHALRLQETTPAYYDGREVVDAPPRLPEEVVARSLQMRTREKAATAGDGGDESELCAVCQDDLRRENRTVVVLRCRHRFHGDCIGKWLQMNNVCPLCKAIVIAM